MTTLQEAAQQALEALDWLHEHGFTRDGPCTHEMADALRAALAAPEQEPVGWHYSNIAGVSVMHWKPSPRLDEDMQAARDYPNAHKVTPLYTAPPQRRPLTEREIGIATGKYDARHSVRIAVARAIEAAHGIKEEK